MYREHGLRPASQTAEKITHDLYPAIFTTQEVLPMLRFGAFTDASVCIYPCAPKISAKVTRCDAHPRIVAYPLDLAGALARNKRRR